MNVVCTLVPECNCSDSSRFSGQAGTGRNSTNASFSIVFWFMSSKEVPRVHKILDFLSIAISLFSIPDNIATPCSVKAYGKY